MIFIYHDYGGTHTTSIAASIHIGLLPKDRVPTKNEILNTPYFDKLSYKDMGSLILRGTDRWGNKVFTVGKGTSKALLPAMQNLTSILKNEWGGKDEVVFINTSPTVPFVMTMGGFTSRALKIKFIGRPLLVAGTKQTYFKIVNLVKSSLKVYNLDL